MYKIVLLIFISNAALICTQKDEEFNINGENNMTTETYHASDQEIAVSETNVDHQAEKEVETEQNEDTKETVIPIAPESSDNVETERAKVPSLDFDFKKAEAEIKAWSENLDCFTSTLGPLKCRMVKKLAKRLFEHTVLADVDFRKLAAHLRAAIKKLDDGNKPMNTEIRNLIQKYKKFIYADQAVPRK